MVEPTRLGPFVVERELGRGGMGAVYAATREGSFDGEAVALKVSTSEIDDRDKKHFLDEAALCARVSHPGVVRILESGTFEDGRPYIVMPLLAGETLGARLERGRFAPDRAIKLFAMLAGAVAALHEQGIVHRDIKPENVMYLAAEDRLVLLDLGIAREIDRPEGTTTRMQLVRGTPGVMAPERFFGVRASASSDVYELAVVLYAMLTASLPWDDATDPESRLRPRHPTEIGVDLPVGLGHVLLEALSTRPERRPTARELGERVAALEGVPIPVRDGIGDTVLAAPLPLMESPPPQARAVVAPAGTGSEPERRPRAAWIGVIAGLVVVGGLVTMSRLKGRTTESRAAVQEANAVVAGTVTADPKALADLPSADPAAVLVAGSARAPRPDPLAAVDVAPSGSSSTPIATPVAAPVAAPAPATAAPAIASTSAYPPAAPGMPWCTKLVNAYCSPAALRLPDGEARCASQRAAFAKTLELPDTTRARGEVSCRDALPSLERSIRTPQASEAAEDMPWCKRLVAAYCNPEVANSGGGDALCHQAQSAWGSRLLSLPPADRAKKNEECARILPAATQAMRQHVRDFAPGSAASARLNGGPPPTP